MTDPHESSTDDATETTGSEPGPTEQTITASAPDSFGLVQVWWGDGKGKTTAALGMALRAVGHGYRVHVLQFLKGGTATVDDVRGEYNAIAALPGITYENTGHYGWHGFLDGTDDDEHTAKAHAALARADSLVDAAAETSLTEPIPLEEPPEAGVHMLILDEILYAVDKGLLDPEDVQKLIDKKPQSLELVCTGSHSRPTYLTDYADLISQVTKEKHPLESGHAARKGTEY